VIEVVTGRESFIAERTSVEASTGVRYTKHAENLWKNEPAGGIAAGPTLDQVRVVVFEDCQPGIIIITHQVV